MLVAAAVCPHPPALVAELAAGAAGELDGLRAACAAAIDAVGAAAPNLLVVVGAGATLKSYGPGSTGTFGPFGVDVAVSLPGGRGTDPPAPATESALPLPFAVGAWLLRQAEWDGEVCGEQVTADAAARTCATLGASIARLADRVAMLVMGDGSACRSQASPRPFDARAAEFDASVAAAMRSGEPAALLDINAVLAAELGASGRTCWQVLAGASEGEVFDAEVLYDDAPYGVGYIVAVWERHG